MSEPRSPTDVLIQAMESADGMKAVIVLFETAEGGITLLSNDLSVAEAIFMLEKIKVGILSARKDEEE